MRKIFILFFLTLSNFLVCAQEGNTAFTYLLLPNSARASALGGTNVSIIENDLSLIYQNPGFLGQEMDKTINLNYLSYVGDIGAGSATFAKALGTKSAWGIGFNYFNYGNMLETTENDEILGDLSARDICGNIFFSSDLTESIRGGITGKFLYSDYFSNTAIGLGVDLGLSYYNRDKDLSIGLVGKNIGRQIKAYDTELLNLPWDIQLGLSQKLGHAPIRYSITAVNLARWESYDLDGNKIPFPKTFFKHFVFGVELIPTDNFWVALGYSVKRGSDMSLTLNDGTGNTLGGFSIGAGLKVKAFSIGCSMAKYYPAATSLMVSISTSLAEMKL